MLWCICFFNYADRQAIFSVFPSLQKEMNLSPGATRPAGFRVRVALWIGRAARGVVVDRIRRKSAIMGGPLRLEHHLHGDRALQNLPAPVPFPRGGGLRRDDLLSGQVSLISDYHGRATRSRALGFLQTSVYVGTIGGGFFAGLIGQFMAGAGRLWCSADWGSYSVSYCSAFSGTGAWCGGNGYLEARNNTPPLADHRTILRTPSAVCSWRLSSAPILSPSCYFPGCPRSFISGLG